jgi:hypothetical protein
MTEYPLLIYFQLNLLLNFRITIIKFCSSSFSWKLQLLKFITLGIKLPHDDSHLAVFVIWKLHLTVVLRKLFII